MNEYCLTGDHEWFTVGTDDTRCNDCGKDYRK